MSANRKSQRKNTVVKANKSVVTLDGKKKSSDLESTSERRLFPSQGPSARGPPSATKFITVAQLCERYGGVSFMWIERRLKDDPTFPKPVKFGRLRFFDIDEVIAWERAQVLKSDAA